jgi:hypothetical protein
LAEPDLTSLLGCARCHPYLGREEVEWELDERGALIFGVVRGSVQILFRSMEGKELPVWVVREGGTFELGIDGWSGVDQTVAATLAQNNILCSLPSDAFDAATAECREAVKLLRESDRALIRELGGLASDRMHTPANRVRHTLWRDTRDAADHSVVYTQEFLAARATTDRSRATRTVTKLRREGTVEVDRRRHRFIVLKPDALKEDE